MLIVKMDVAAGVRLSALFWLSRDGKNEPQHYQGGRELDDIVKYLADTPPAS